MAVPYAPSGATPSVAGTGGGGNVAPLSMNYQTSNNSSSGSSSNSSRSWLPDWYLNGGQTSTDFYKNQLGGLPTGGYQDPRVAGFDPTQASGIGQGQGYLNESSPMYAQGGAMMGEAGNLMQDSSTWNEQGMMQHMNPYLNGALNTVSNLANQNLSENVMPGVNSTFTGAGQFGSTRNGDFLGRAIRDNQQVISNTQGKMVNQAYGQATTDYRGWAEQGLTAGGAMSGLGNQMGQYGITGLNTGMNLGGLNQTQNQKMLDANKAKWEDNYNFPMSQFGALSSAYNNSVGRLQNQSEGSGSQSQSGSSGSSSYSF